MTAPKLYRCPKCKQTIVVDVPAVVTCVKCARDMQPLKGETLSHDSFQKGLQA